jgi:plasmid replication initiation protein
MEEQEKQLPLRLFEPENGRFMVVKSHKLIQAQSTLNAREQKLLAAAIAQINPKAEYPGELSVSLTSNEVSRLTGISSNHIHTFLAKATDAIMNAKFVFQEPGSPDFKKMTIAPVTEYERKVFTMTFSSHAKDELIQLSRYASYELKQIENLTTKYSIRLFELFADAYNDKRRGRQRAIFAVDDLYFRLGIVDQHGNELAKGYVEKFSKFKSRILLPSLAEINKKTDISIEIEDNGFRRIGRRIGEIEFFIRKQFGDGLTIDDNTLEKALLRIDVPDKKIANWKVLSELAPCVESEECSVEVYLQRCIDYMNDAISSGQDVANKVGFLDYLIKNYIVDSPAWANPYSDMYKGKPVEQDFVKQYFLGQFQFIEEDDARTLAKHGIIGSSYVNLFNDFKSNRKKMR